MLDFLISLFGLPYLGAKYARERRIEYEEECRRKEEERKRREEELERHDRHLDYIKRNYDFVYRVVDLELEKEIDSIIRNTKGITQYNELMEFRKMVSDVYGSVCYGDEWAKRILMADKGKLPLNDAEYGIVIDCKCGVEDNIFMWKMALWIDKRLKEHGIDDVMYLEGKTLPSGETPYLRVDELCPLEHHDVGVLTWVKK